VLLETIFIMLFTALGQGSGNLWRNDSCKTIFLRWKQVSSSSIDVDKQVFAGQVSGYIMIMSWCSYVRSSPRR